MNNYHLELDIALLDEWNMGWNHPAKLLIAGPCSAETEEQVMQTCTQLAETQQVQLLRAGIWKPRTRPNSFEGVGSIGLKWIKQAGLATQLPVTVEVANVRHVERALQAGIDVLWIGARTTVNPFSVQEIADALQGVDIPVMVKNPINPDLSLWLGAFERLNKVGIRKMAAIHRGFSTYQKTRFRNNPHWEIPIELMRQVPQLPLICDPSHICGRRDTLLEIAQKAIDLNFGGLMIEAHISPDTALSDAEQQLTPTNYGALINKLVYRKATNNDPEFLQEMSQLRDNIDELDKEVLQLLAKRMSIVRQIGKHKLANNVTIFQRDRWDSLLANGNQVGINEGLTDKFIEALYTAVHKEAIRHQTMVMNPPTP